MHIHEHVHDGTVMGHANVVLPWQHAHVHGNQDPGLHGLAELCGRQVLVYKPLNGEEGGHAELGRQPQVPQGRKNLNKTFISQGLPDLSWTFKKPL